MLDGHTITSPRQAMEQTQTAVNKKANWVASEGSFSKFLDWLDDGTPSQGESYLRIRTKLVTYFDRKGCLIPDDLADETLNRVHRRLEEEGKIESETPAKYCYTVARFVFLEHLRSGHRREVSIDNEELRLPAITEEPAGTEAEERERALNCLEKCLGEQNPENRRLLIEYYRGQQREKIENRRKLAEELGITMNALAIRTFRLREKLESCVFKCSEGTK